METHWSFWHFFLLFFGAIFMFEVKHLGYEAGDFYFFDAKKWFLTGVLRFERGRTSFHFKVLFRTFFTKVSGVPGPYEGTGSTGNVFGDFANKNCHTSSRTRVLALNEDDIR